MRITFRYHALVRERVGREEESYDLPAQARVQDVLRCFCEKYPAVALLVGHCHLAVNDEFAEASQVLAEDDRVDLLPPYGGG